MTQGGWILHRVQDSISKIDGGDAVQPPETDLFFRRFFTKYLP